MFLGTASVPALAGDSGAVANQMVVRPRQGVTIQTINARYGSSTLRSLISRRWHLLAPPPTLDEQGFQQALIADPDVEVAELNFFAEDIDAGGGSQSIFLPRSQLVYEADVTPLVIGAPAAQGVSTGAGVTVGVVDSGIDATRPLLAARIAAGGFNFINQNTDTRDLPDGIDSNNDGRLDEMAGHGTFVAGLIARIAPDARLLPVRVLDSDGLTNVFLVAQGIYHAIDQGAQVVNVSLGATVPTAPMAGVVSDAEAEGVILVASGENESTSSPAREPAGLRALGALGVAATTPGDILAPFSNFGPWISFSAPGVSVISTLPGGGYGEASGTSFAAPLVAGTSALLRSSCPSAPIAFLRDWLGGTSLPIDGLNPGLAGQLGAGRVDAAAALGAQPAMALPCWADTDGNGTIRFSDLIVVLSVYGATYQPGTAGLGDVDRNGVVEFADISLILTSFNVF